MLHFTQRLPQFARFPELDRLFFRVGKQQWLGRTQDGPEFHEVHQQVVGETIVKELLGSPADAV